MSLLVEKTGLFFKVAGWATFKLVPALVVVTFFKFPWAVLKFLALHGRDGGRFLGNIFTPQLKKGNVVKMGKAGHGGVWPPFVAPGKTDSRSPCPYLNAMANHGILPHDGKKIQLKDLGVAMVDSFNFSPTLVEDTINSVAGLYGRDFLDLGDLSAHNVVEHDASLIRHDAYYVEDQTIIAHDLVKDMLDAATGPVTAEHPEGYLKPIDLSRTLALREARSKRDNPVFLLDTIHRFFGASNASLMYEVAGGDVKSLRTILNEERLPDGFESSLRQRFGYTMKEFHMRSLEIFLGISLPKLPADDIKTADAVAKAAEA
ncbi:Cloroperoxidase [Clavulina sp. PMI_390]|nr:Cloroperoxidase [Clavulina sp. PMI_390]